MAATTPMGVITTPAGAPAATATASFERPRRERGGRKHKRPNQAPGGHSAFAEELAKAL